MAGQERRLAELEGHVGRLYLLALTSFTFLRDAGVTGEQFNRRYNRIRERAEAEGRTVLEAIMELLADKEVL